MSGYRLDSWSSISCECVRTSSLLPHPERLWNPYSRCLKILPYEDNVHLI